MPSGPPQETPRENLLQGFRIGEHIVRPETNSIRGISETTQLNPKAMAVLVRLAENPRRLVTKKTLISAVWNDAYIGEDVLSQAVYELRKALGDDARQPQFIETIHRQGYRLIAEVQPFNDGATARRLLRPWLLWTAALAIVCTLAFSVLLTPETPPPTCRILFQDTDSDDYPSFGALRQRIKSSLESRCAHSQALASDRKGASGLLVRWSVRKKDQDLELRAWTEGSQLRSEIIVEGSRLDADLLVWTFGSRVLGELKSLSEDATGIRSGTRHIDESMAAYDKGKIARNSLEIDKAIDIFQGAIASWTENVLAHDALANAFEIKGEEEKARREIRTALGVVDRADEVVEKILRRRLAQIDENFSEAGKILEELAEDFPVDPGHLQRFGWHLATHTSECGRALEKLEKAQSIDPRPRRKAYLADAYRSCGQPENARRVLEEYRSSSPKEASPRLALVELLIWIGEYEDAQTELALLESTMDTRDSARPVAHDLSAEAEKLRGDLARARGRFSAAEGHYRSFYGKATYPTEIALAKSRLADLYLQWGKIAAAKTAAEEALAKKASSVAANWMRGLVALGEGDRKTARWSLQHLEHIRDDPGSLHERELIHHLRGQIALYDEDFDRATESLNKALAMKPADRAFFSAAVGHAFVDQKRWSEAEAAFRQALEFNPNHVSSLCGLGHVKQRQGDGATAREIYQACLEVLGPENRDAPLAAHARRALGLAA